MNRLLQLAAAGSLLTNISYCAADTASPQGYRIFISVDMEGIAGATSPKQFSTDGLDYQQSRRIMTEELLAAIAGARKAGASEFVVTDGHGDGQNLLLEMMPADVQLIRGSPLPLQMMQGIQGGQFDAAIFLGYHAGASSIQGIHAHTFSSARVSELKLNGIAASEGYFNAAIAGNFGVPVIMVSGDRAATEELRPFLRGAEFVVVKQSIGFQAAEVISPERAQELISDAAARAVKRIGHEPPVVRLSSPVTVDVTFHYARPAELLAWLQNVKREGSRTIQYQSQDAAAAMQFLSFVLHYNVTLEP